MISQRTGHSEGCSVSLGDYQTIFTDIKIPVKSSLLGEVLFIFGAQSMSHLEPVHGHSVGVVLLIKAVCLPSRAPPYTETGFLLSVYPTI